MDKFSFVIAATVTAALPVFAEFTPSTEDAERFAAGEPVTNSQKTAEFKKFGKIKAKEAIVTDITDNVLKKGENVWSEDLLGDDDPPDNIWGYMIKRKNAYSDITSWYLVENRGQEYWSTNANNSVNNDGFTYIGLLKDGNITNVPFQEGTNRNGRVGAPKLMLPVANNTVKTEKGCEIFAHRDWVKQLLIKLGKTEIEVNTAIESMTP